MTEEEEKTSTTAEKVAAPQSAKKTSEWSGLLELSKSLALFLSIAFLMRASVVEAFKIPSGSMLPTIEINDHILVSKLTYGIRLPFVTKTLFNFRDPKRGDIVVFTLPEDDSTNIIKLSLIHI